MYDYTGRDKIKNIDIEMSYKWIPSRFKNMFYKIVDRLVVLYGSVRLPRT